MWANAENGTESFLRAGIAIGTLLVTSRRYTLDGEWQYVPGHIGIVTATEGDAISFVHANANAGVVEERPLTTRATILGSLTVSSSLMEV
jgi:hypothetical protein